jgi:hypothetical protein
MRIGKIARLPAKLRQEVNVRLDAGQTGEEICRWLNEEPETKQTMARHFSSEPVTESNVTAWRVGGFADWRKHQETLSAMQTMRQVSQASGIAVTEELSLYIAARVAVLLQDTEKEKAAPKERLKILSRVAAIMEIIRHGDHRGWVAEATRHRMEDRASKGRPVAGTHRGIPPEVMEQVERELRLL